MPSFLSRHGSKRLKKPRKTGDQETTQRAGIARIGGKGGAGGDSKSSLVSFIPVPNSSSHSSTSLNKLRRSESSKRRFGLNNILTRGKNRTDTGQGAVSSKVGDMRHRTAGSRPAGELEAGSKDGILPATSAQASAAAIQLVRTPPETLSKPANTTLDTNNSPTQTITPTISLPRPVSPIIFSPAELGFQQQDDSMATTGTMTSVMQQPGRRLLSLTLAVDDLPLHVPQTSSSLLSGIPQISRFDSSLPSGLLPDNGRPTSVPNDVDMSYFPLSSPVVSNATAISFSRPALVDSSGPLLRIMPTGALNDTIGTPLGYYITPSQTPTLDRSDAFFKPSPVPTVVRPGPSTPPLTESSISLSLSVTKVTTEPTAPQNRLHLANNSSVPIPGDRPLNNGPPTPTSSISSQKEKDPNRRVNFVGTSTPTSSIRSVRSNAGNVGNMYPNPPQQNRLNNYRPPPGRPRPGQPPLHGQPRRKILARAPPRPPSPIYTLPPDMKRHVWQPLKPSQLECSVGHILVPFRNKQHSILCTVCRSMEFEGRGEPVKRSFYCSWCAVRMCGGCKAELGVCKGGLTELWDRTEEKRDQNMAMVRDGNRWKKDVAMINDGSRQEKGEDAASKGQGSNRESFGLKLDASTSPVGEQGRGKMLQRIPGVDARGPQFPVQGTPPQVQPQRQLAIPQPQQYKAPQLQQSRAPQPQRPEALRQQRLGPPQPQQLTPPQMPSYRGRVPQQPPQLSNRGPPLPQKPYNYLPAPTQVAPLDFLSFNPPTRLPPPVPQLTPAETERYRPVTVPSNQKPPQSSTVVPVDVKRKEASTFAASLKGSITKKRNWFRSFGKKKEV